MGRDMKASAQAHHALIDPLVEPDPSDETGLNSHFGSTFAPRGKLPTPPHSAGGYSPSASIRPQSTGTSVETNPYRRQRASSAAQEPRVQFADISPRKPYNNISSHYPSPPNSASPRKERFADYRNDAFGSSGSASRPRRSSQPNPFNDPSRESAGISRSGSLRERYPGDMSHRPLDIIRKDAKTAHRAHHLRKKNFQGPDVIDRLDKISTYHHEGPYDATYLSRNLSYTHSPVAAVQETNEAALRATPRENILDSINKHHPMDGTALIPPGVPDKFGRILDYEEGADLMREPGFDYKRWPGVTYHPDDLKGKGEPSFSADRARKEKKAYGESGTELQSRRRNLSLGSKDRPQETVAENLNGNGLGRSNTTGRSMGTTLRKRFGSIRRRKDA